MDLMDLMDLEWEFSGELWYWRGPSPFYFLTLPEDACAEIRDESNSVSYGWGMIPVSARIGDTAWNTSLWPKDGRYLLPVKANVRSAEGVNEGELVTVRVGLRR